MATETDGLSRGDDGVVRCAWHGEQADYRRYHDEEWGRPAGDDRRLFEKLCLEGFQAGLSWLTILRKRENFREAFANFEFAQLTDRDEADIERHLHNAGIIRHRGKIASVYNNARRAVELVEERGSLAAYFWSFEPSPDDRPATIDRAMLVANPTTEISKKISRDLKKRGWSFVGPTTVYAFMQAMGMVNDHLQGCAFRPVIEAERAKFRRP